MSFYRNAAGHTAKLMRTSSSVVVMFAWCTKFFSTEKQAVSFLLANGFYN